MAYLKIYPRLILIKKNANGEFPGLFTFEVEQYGLEFSTQTVDAELMENYKVNYPYWVKIAPINGIETPQFSSFIYSFNYYIFNVIKTIPQFNNESLVWKIDFEGLMFNLSEDRPMLQRSRVW